MCMSSLPCPIIHSTRWHIWISQEFDYRVMSLPKGFAEKIEIIGGKKGFEFKLKECPANWEDFRIFFMAFADAFEMSFTLRAEQFEKIRKYAKPETIKEVDNLF